MNKYNTNDSTSYSLGMSLTIEALKHKSQYIKKILLSNKASKNKQLDYLIELANKNNILIEIDDKTIDKLSNKENCYCIGVFDKYKSKLETNNHVLLYGFNDYGDLGTILRSCISFDFKDIVLINSDIDYFDPRCIRSSMGSIFLCNIESYKSLNDYFKKYNKQNIYPFVSNSDNELLDINLKEPYSIIISSNYYDLDNIYKDGYYIKHSNNDEISLSIKSSIILQHIYDLKRNL